ncbi:MAG: SLBB domain-containing protein [Candidatus Eisenbacteria bacterium]
MTPRFVRVLVALGLLAFPGAIRAQASQTSEAGSISATGEGVARSDAARKDDFPETGSASVLAGPVDPTRYRLGPGDVLSLEMTGRVDRHVLLPVDAEGRMNVPEIGVVDAGGRTLDAVRSQLLGRIRPLYSGARVDLRLVRLRVFKVYVAGQGKGPGVVRATGATRASEILAGADALGPEASRRNIELRHRNGKSDRVDLDAFAYLAREDANPYLDDGDVLVVPPRKERVFAYGAFGRPGEYELAPGDQVVDLVALAGGLLPGTDKASGLLVRFVTPTTLDSIPCNLGAGAAEPNRLPLQNQDRLYAREFTNFERAANVSLLGEVLRPGPYAIREGRDRVSTLLERAGGPTTLAARGRIQIFRNSEPSGQRDIEFERLSRLSRSEMTDAEYETFKTKLAAQQASFVLDYDRLLSTSGDYDVLLRDRDLIMVDRETQAVRVSGEVQRPALLEYQARRAGEEYIQLAGGFTGRASKGKVRVTRAGSNHSISLNEAGMIQPGDFIWVPEKKEAHFWATLKDVLVVAGSVATIVILIQNAAKP